MHYIKDLFENNITEHTHTKFVRYSKGNFTGPLLNLKFTKTQIKVGASFHFVDELLYLIAEVKGNIEVHIKGSLIWNKDLSEELKELGIKYLKVSKSRGIFKYALDNEILIKDFMDKLGKYNILATITTDDFTLVIKTSFPKPNKGFKADFCKVTFPIEFKDKILSEFIFDIDGIQNMKVKQIKLAHKIDINEIKLPQIENFDEARKLAKRVGLLKREIIIDGAEAIEKEIEIEV